MPRMSHVDYIDGMALLLVRRSAQHSTRFSNSTLTPTIHQSVIESSLVRRNIEFELPNKHER